MPVAGGRRAAQITSLMTTPPRLRSQAGGLDFFAEKQNSDLASISVIRRVNRKSRWQQEYDG